MNSMRFNNRRNALSPLGITARICLAMGVASALMGAAQEDDAEISKAGGFVVICPIEDMIDDGTLVLVERAIREGKNAEAIIFSVDTPGGRVDSAVAVTQAIIEAKIQTIAYVHGMGATSAGALISFACDDIMMSSGSTIGDVMPVVPTQGGQMQPAGEKATSFVRAKMRALAERKGHNPDIGEAMVDQDIELRAWRGEDGKLIIRASDKGPNYRDDDDSTLTERDVRSVEERVAERLIDEFKDVLGTDDETPPDVQRAIDEEEKSGEDEAAEPKDDTMEAPPEDIADMSDPAGRVVLAKGKLLTLSAEEAVKWGLTPITCDSLYEVLSYHELNEYAKVEIQPTWSEDLYKFLIHPITTSLLLMAGLGGIYVEVRTPGFGLPGIIGVACLALFFGSRAVVGLADWIDLLLLMVGFILIVIEVLILPGFGVPGLAGIICLLIGIYLSFTRVVIPEFAWDFARIEEMVTSLAITTAGMIAIMVIGAKYLPRTKFYDRLILAQEQDANAGWVVQTDAEEASVGMTGTAASNLRPAGRGRFMGKTYDVVSRAEFINKGDPIVIIRVEGNRYVVDPAEEEK